MRHSGPIAIASLAAFLFVAPSFAQEIVVAPRSPVEPAEILSDDALMARAAAVIIGRVVDVRSTRDDQNGAQQYVGISVESDLKGNVTEREIVLKQAATGHAPSFRDGERVLLFLETSARDRTLSTVSGWQGKWSIESERDGRAYAVRFDDDASGRGIFGGVGERRTLTTFVNRLRSGERRDDLPHTFVAQPAAAELRDAAHQPAVSQARFGANGSTFAALAPAAPGSLAGAVAGSTVSLSWQAPSGTVTTYVIEAGSAPGLANLANFATGNAATTFTAAGIGAGVYYVRVRAANADGISPPSNEVTVVVGGCVPPAAPTSLQLVSSSGGTVVLQWSPSALALSYIVEAGSAPGLANLANGDIGSNLPGLRATGVGSGVYYVRVRARNACGVSAPSNEIVVTIGGTTSGLSITFDPDPAIALPLGSCGALANNFYSWYTNIAVTNTGSVGLNITRWTTTAYDPSGTLIPSQSGSAGSFAAAFLPCDASWSPLASVGSTHINPGEFRCMAFSFCLVRRESSGSNAQGFEGVDDLGRPVTFSRRIQLPTWSPPRITAAAGADHLTTRLPALAVDTLRPQP
jgi:hypothetical protein